MKMFVGGPNKSIYMENKDEKKHGAVSCITLKKALFGNMYMGMGYYMNF